MTRRLRTIVALVAVAVTAALLAGCGSDASDAASAGQIEGTTWELRFDSLGLAASRTIQPTLTMENGTATGFAGCNTYHTAYHLNGSSLRFDTPATTLIACGPAETAIEKAFLQRLGRVATYRTTDNSLVLADASGATVLQFVPANTSLAGTWTVVGYLVSDQSAFSSVVAGTDLTINFGSDGNVSGTTGCNSYSGPWKQGPGDAVSIGPLAATLRACTDPALDKQEMSLLNALNTSVKADVTSRGATFFNAGGLRTLELTR